MARKPQVRYFASRGAYYCQLKGVQHKLAVGPNDGPEGPTFVAATKKYGQLIARNGADDAKDLNTCRVILEEYLRFISTRKKKTTLAVRQSVFTAFCKRLGETPVGTLTHRNVYEWLDEMRQQRAPNKHGYRSRWTDGSVRNAIESLHAAFNWAAKP